MLGLSYLKNLFFLSKLLFICLKSGIILNILLLYINKNWSKKSNIQESTGKKLVHILPKLGPAFIKLGQVLSTRSDLLGENITKQLIDLQDKLPPLAEKEIEKIFESEFHTTIDESFSFFDRKSYSAASVAQVHKAITKSNKVVAIKILRPKIKVKYLENLNFIQFLFSFINNFLNTKKKIKINEIIDALKKSCEIELDLRLEGAAADKIRENCRKDTDIYIPKIYWSLTSKHILTSEWIDGISISKKDDLIKAKLDLELITKKLAITFFNQACRDGFFHADVHPGNIIIKRNGDIALVDFGIVCNLDFELKTFIAEVVHGFLNKNYDKVTNLHFKMGFISNNHSKYKFELALRSIGELVVGKSLEEISLARLLKSLFEVSRNFSIKIQPELLLLHKTVLTIEGTSYNLDPKINMWKLVSPWIKNWAKKNLGRRGQLLKINYQRRKIVNQIKYLIDNRNNKIVESKNTIRYGGLSLNIIIALIFFSIGLALAKILL